MKRILYIILMTLTLPTLVCAQNSIRIQGTVTARDSGKAIYNVAVIYNDIALTYTDRDGKYQVIAPRNASLKFFITGYDALDVNINNRQMIDVTMNPQVIEIEEIVVKGKAKVKSVFVEPSELNVVGNTFHLDTKTKLPDELFSSRHRYIFQPKLINVTRKSEVYLRPIVVDGRVFEVNNNRLNNGDMSRDQIHQFTIRQHPKGPNSEIYTYSDSLEIEGRHIDDDYRVECYMAINSLIENKNDYLDTLEIARGTKNPLRFLNYRDEALPYMDSLRIPKPELKLLSERGITSIGFMINSDKIDKSDPSNQEKIDEISSKIQGILKNPDATIRSILVKGYASPDGQYDANKTLALKRTGVILKHLSKALTGEQREYISLINDSDVESWSSVAALMREDGREEAAKVTEIVEQNDNNYAKCSYMISRLPYYRSLIVKEYLPRLRRVEYVIDYSTYRNLNDHEIWDRYNSGESDISRFEYWRLIETSKDSVERISFEEEALRRYPNFEIVANRVALRAIAADTAHFEILRPSLEVDAPNELVYNQTLIALLHRELDYADSLMTNLVKRDFEDNYIGSIVDAIMGRYAEALPAFEKRGGINEVLLLLSMDRNKEATAKVLKMLELEEYERDGLVWYIRAVCANRLEDLTMALMALQQALELAPELEETAKVDSDILDILSIIRPEQTDIK